MFIHLREGHKRLQYFFLMERLGEGWKVGHGSVPIVGGVSGVCASQLSREPLCTSVMSPAANERANKQTASLARRMGLDRTQQTTASYASPTAPPASHSPDPSYQVQTTSHLPPSALSLSRARKRSRRGQVEEIINLALLL